MLDKSMTFQKATLINPFHKQEAFTELENFRAEWGFLRSSDFPIRVKKTRIGKSELHYSLLPSRMAIITSLACIGII